MQRLSQTHERLPVIGAFLGHETIPRSIEGGLFVCPVERSNRAYWHYHIRTWHTLFGVPVFPGKVVGDYVECFSCRGTFDPRIVGSTHPALWAPESD